MPSSPSIRLNSTNLEDAARLLHKSFSPIFLDSTWPLLLILACLMASAKKISGVGHFCSRLQHETLTNTIAWRIPIIAMQIYPVLLLSFIYRLPESPRWFIFHERDDDAHEALVEIYGDGESDEKFDQLKKAHEEESSHEIGYNDMIWPSSPQFHPTMITVMGQINQALTGYGAVSVYGPQIFELLGFGVMEAEYITMGNYVSYFFLMTFAWLLIDRVGRRILMVLGAFGIAICFLILTLLGGLAMDSDKYGIPVRPIGITGGVMLYVATGLFGIGWLSQVWLIPTEIFPSTSRAQGSAISVIIWGIANFAVTLFTPIGFNNLHYWLFLVFAITNLFAGWWTWVRHCRHYICNFIAFAYKYL